MTRDMIIQSIDSLTRFEFAVCAVCSIEFGSPILRNRKRDGLAFYCPIGHANVCPEAKDFIEAEQREKKEMAELVRIFSLGEAE